jgi:hypothetical protein
MVAQAVVAGVMEVAGQMVAPEETVLTALVDQGQASKLVFFLLELEGRGVLAQQPVGSMLVAVAVA